MAIEFGVSNRADGNMLVAIGDELFPLGQENRRRFLNRQGIERAVVCRLAHGTEVKVVTAADTGTVVWGIDALITREPDLFLALTVADCFPVYFWNEESGVVAIAHAGWRGVAGGVVSATVAALSSTFAVAPDDLSAAIGPGVRSCHFVVHHDVASRFANYPSFIVEREDETYIDLPGIILAQLGAAGVPEASIRDSGECTYCLPDRYFSHRRDHTEPIEAMLAHIGVRGG